MLGDRFWAFGAMEDVNNAVELAGDAVKLTPRDSPSLILRVINYGNALKTKHLGTEDPQDLDNSIIEYYKAKSLAIEGTPHYCGAINNLGAALRYRYDLDQETHADDLDSALELSKESLVLAPPGHADRSRLETPQ
jgi:hypothetical protein